MTERIGAGAGRGCARTALVDAAMEAALTSAALDPAAPAFG